MSLNITRKKTKEYLYFTINGSKKLYLGTSGEPKEGRIEEAIRHLKAKIRKYENEVQKLENFLQKEVPEFNIVYPLVVFDLDGVIFDKPWHDSASDKVAVSTWDVIFQELEIYDYHEKLKQKFEKGGFKTYMEWTEAACRVVQPFLEKNTFERTINQRPFIQGAVDVFQVLHRNKTITAVITGSFDALAQRAKKELGGIDHIFAHTKLHFNGSSLESWELQPTDYVDKAKWVKQIAKTHSIPLAECAYIGDDANDVEAFKEVGLSIAFNSNKIKVNQAAKVVIESRDLKSILPHLCVKK